MLENGLKQLKTAISNSLWAYIQEGLLSEGYLRLRFERLIFRRAFLGGGGGGLSEFYGIFHSLQSVMPLFYSWVLAAILENSMRPFRYETRSVKFISKALTN